MRSFLALFVSLGLTIPGLARDLTPSEQDRVVQAVTSQLRDPGSAQFSSVDIVEGVACGFVNAKNGFGGYVGSMPFVVVMSPSKVYATMIGSDDITFGVVVRTCVRNGHPEYQSLLAN